MTTKTPVPGEPAPDFEAGTDRGEKVRLGDFRGRKVVLYFYPKDDTKGCTTQACGFRDAHDEIESHGAVVLGVSPDGEESHARFKNKYDLPFALIVDEDHRIAEAYGVWQEKKMYGRTYMGIVRSHFVIDERGKILDARVSVRPAASVEAALEVVAR